MDEWSYQLTVLDELELCIHYEWLCDMNITKQLIEIGVRWHVYLLVLKLDTGIHPSLHHHLLIDLLLNFDIFIPENL